MLYLSKMKKDQTWWIYHIFHLHTAIFQLCRFCTLVRVQEVGAEPVHLLALVTVRQQEHKILELIKADYAVVDRQRNGPNHGRIFWTCPKDRNDPQKCKYFEWEGPRNDAQQ
ncbi:unnamed protein product [Gongylonema pulchrum]|uniref:Zf-GRF domain-containing protein n=1 Tax=Gongylonema pulchrum TaxID=637853 RepID=A0A183DDP1_9BILA|nr:unnamed protein product [Gongylonema pulchrum]